MNTFYQKTSTGDVVNFIHKVSMCNGRQIKDPFYVVSPREKAPSESIMEHKEVQRVYLTNLLYNLIQMLAPPHL